jgi:hypothetical protein
MKEEIRSRYMDQMEVTIYAKGKFSRTAGGQEAPQAQGRRLLGGRRDPFIKKS